MMLALLYAWLAHAPIRTLDQTFAPPPGYHRVAVAEGSFGSFLRGLPLRAAGAPVLAYDGSEIHPGDDPTIAAVADLDVGTRDLQQCADSIMRLHAEWLWAEGRPGDAVYPSGPKPKKFASHEAFRSWLDGVFADVGTENLDDGEAHVKRADLAPGDFFVMGGHPGHAVLILDVAVDGSGHEVALLGQGYMPAQDFQVLAGPDGAWFRLDGDAVVTPYWKPFPWSSLRRMKP